MDEERAEKHRLRNRALAVQIKRALITAANGVQQWLDDDPDHVPSYEERVTPGDTRTFPKPASRPPAQFR